MKKKGGNPAKKRSKDNKRKNVKEIDWQASASFFSIMEDERIKYEQERLRGDYFNFNF